MKEAEPIVSGPWKNKNWYEAVEWENKDAGQIVINVECGKKMKKNSVERCFIAHDGTLCIILKKGVKIDSGMKQKIHLILSSNEKQVGTLGEYV